MYFKETSRKSKVSVHENIFENVVCQRRPFVQHSMCTHCLSLEGIHNITSQLITTTIRCGRKLLIHYQISTVQSLKFGNGEAISSHTLPGMWLLIHAGIKINPRKWKRPLLEFINNILNLLLPLYGFLLLSVKQITGWIKIAYHIGHTNATNIQRLCWVPCVTAKVRNSVLWYSGTWGHLVLIHDMIVVPRATLISS